MSHPFLFTWTAQKDARPIEVVGGEGCFFETRAGDRWLDFGSLSYNAHLGHNHPRVVEAIKAQADTLCLTGAFAVFDAKTEVANELLRLAPEGFTKVFFGLGGAEAVENAMKIARLATGRKNFISRKRSYHGATFGALSLTGDYRRAPVEPVLSGVFRVDNDSMEDFEKTLSQEGPESFAAVFMEPVPGANGVDLPQPGYFERVRELCTKHGIALVFDEVLNGFGRTGKVFGFEHFGAQPDMITVAKGLTAGHSSLSAVLIHERLAERFEEELLYAGLTNYAHPIGCAAANAALSVYKEEGLYQCAEALGKPMRAGLDTLAASVRGVSRSRHIGLLGAVDIEATPSQWNTFRDELAARHLWVHAYPGRGSVVVSPPLIISEEDIDDGLQRLTGAATAAFGKAKG